MPSINYDFKIWTAVRSTYCEVKVSCRYQFYVTTWPNPQALNWSLPRLPPPRPLSYFRIRVFKCSGFVPLAIRPHPVPRSYCVPPVTCAIFSSLDITLPATPRSLGTTQFMYPLLAGERQGEFYHTGQLPSHFSHSSAV